MSFAHLHLHTEYSLLDGACRIEKLLDRARGVGANRVWRLRITASCMAPWIFIKQPKARGIHPIIGCEVYVASRSRFDKVYELDAGNRHLGAAVRKPDRGTKT